MFFEAKCWISPSLLPAEYEASKGQPQTSDGLTGDKIAALETLKADFLDPLDLTPPSLKSTTLQSGMHGFSMLAAPCYRMA